MKMKLTGIGLAVLLGLGLLFMGTPTIDEKAADLDPTLQKNLDDRAVQIDSAELLALMNDPGVRLKILDVRDESDYNQFHLLDAERFTLDDFRDKRKVKNLPALTVMVLAANNEIRSQVAWKMLSAQKIKNLYILAGGINQWISIYSRDAEEIAATDKGDDEAFRYIFASLGARHPASEPDPDHVSPREFTKKVKSIGKPARKSGGCS